MIRLRRSELSTPGSSEKMMAKAAGSDADLVFLDLEDAVAPEAKESARKNVVDALANGDWGERTRVVRVNDLTTQWTYRDVIELTDDDHRVLRRGSGPVRPSLPSGRGCVHSLGVHHASRPARSCRTGSCTAGTSGG